MITFEQIGKYKITRKLGQGSFGVVYKGRDAYLKRDVAIKICSVEDEGLRQRFFREAEIAGRLVHKHIVTVYEFGFEGDIPYLVQEILSGEDLGPIVKRRTPLAPSTRLEYLLQVARGLGYAHSEGVIHRDIKPGNIRVLEDGQVKIMDFGIAKLASAETQLTQKGVTMGTASYLPPEQVRGSDLDHRADIFSFGVLAYELLTYERPFRGSTLSALVYQILYKVPQPMTEVWTECPSPLSDLIARCLDKKPERRFDSFHDLIPELEAIQADIEAGEWPALETVPTSPALHPRTAANLSEPSDVLSPTIISRTTQGVLEGKVGEYTISTVASARDVLRPPSDTKTENSTRPIAARSDAPGTTQPIPSAVSAEDAALKTRILDAKNLEPEAVQTTQRIPIVSSNTSPAELEADLTSTANQISELVAQGKLEAAKEQLEATINRQDLTGVSTLSEIPAAPEVDATSTQRPSPTSPLTVPRPKSSGAKPADQLSNQKRASKQNQVSKLAPAQASAPSLTSAQPPVTAKRLSPPLGKQASPSSRLSSVEPTEATGSDTYRTVIRQPIDRRKWAAIAAAIALVVLVGSWVTLRESGSAPPEIEAPESSVAAVANLPPTTQPLLGALIINATPWAEVTEITDSKGYLKDLPPLAQTPLYLELPPDSYTVQLRDPTGETVETCTLDITLEAVASCTPTFAETDVTEYFKASGWWR